MAFYGVACLGGIGILLRCEVTCTWRVVGSVAFGLLCFCLGYAFVSLGRHGLTWVGMGSLWLAWVRLVCVFGRLRSASVGLKIC